MTARIDLDNLESLARACVCADREIFYFDAGTEVYWELRIDGKPTTVPQTFASCPFLKNAAHIAAASPPVVLALVARIRELESELRGCADAFAGVTDDPDPYDVMAVVEKGTVIP